MSDTATHHVECLTSWPGEYFHGFYNIPPWDRSGRYVLCHRVPCNDRMPLPEDEADIGLIDTHLSNFTPITRTHAWNFQLGSMAHWVDQLHPDCFIHNTRLGSGDDARLASVIHHWPTGRQQPIDSPIFVVSHDHRTALGFNLARPYAINPGYAYAGVPYALQSKLAPDDEGITHIDLATGRCRLILSFAQMRQQFFIPAMEHQSIIMGRLLYNADDSRLAFSFRFKHPQTNKWVTSIVTADMDGGNLWQLLPWDWQCAHFDWRGRNEMMVWCKPPGSAQAGFHLLRDFTHDVVPFAQGSLPADGHCCFSPDGSRLACDSFPDKDRMQSLHLLDAAGGYMKLIGRFAAPSAWRGDLRCDLHPCWNAENNAILFDSLHEGQRAVYQAKLT